MSCFNGLNMQGSFRRQIMRKCGPQGTATNEGIMAWNKDLKDQLLWNSFWR